MTNADKFKGIFRIYATELWSKSYKEFSDWLNEDVPDTNVGDTISRQAAIEELRRMMIALYGYDAASIISCAIYKLQNLPSAETNRKMGKWIHDGYDHPHGVDWMHCSECGKRDAYLPATMTNYCPNCGAMMEGSANE